MSAKLARAIARSPRTLGEIVRDAIERGAVTDSGNCWIWQSGNKSGYANIGIACTVFNAHKVFYTYFVADVPEGLHLDHLCRNHSCVNPWHLEPVTPKINVRRGVIARLGAVNGPSHPSDRVSYRALGMNGSAA